MPFENKTPPREEFGLTEAAALVNEMRHRGELPNGSGQLIIHVHDGKPKFMEIKTKGMDWRGSRQ